MTTGKTITLTRWTFVGKVMSLLFNMLSRLVITFLPRSKHLLISWLQSPSAVILEPKKIVWVPKNWCFWTVVLKTFESPLDCKEIQPVYPKGGQSWVFIGRTDTEGKLQYFGHLMQRVDSLEKTLMLGGILGWEEKGMTEDEMAGWYHWLDGHEFGWTLGVGNGQRGLACCNSWGHRESD